MSGELTARDVIERAVTRVGFDNATRGTVGSLDDYANAILTEFDAAGLEVTEKPAEVDTEWSIRFPDGLQGLEGRTEDWCRDYVDQAESNGRHGRKVIRRTVRRGPWEVAP